ncbi:MAG: hypothetical protein AAGD25_30150 [Cyanobacteria bacterium P01_F01_bin.150]
MTIMNQVQEVVKFVWEGTARIFGPDDNTYPATGVQPYTGEPYSKERQRHEM